MEAVVPAPKMKGAALSVCVGKGFGVEEKADRLF